VGTGIVEHGQKSAKEVIPLYSPVLSMNIDMFSTGHSLEE
jgi:hypothetical protein